MRRPEAAPFLEPLPPEERFASWHLVEADRRIVSRGAAAVRLLECLRPLRPFGRLARRLQLERLLGAAYGIVASQRHRLGRLTPEGEAPYRFP